MCACVYARASCSSQRLHALQLELAAVQLLRQQLEEGIKTNEGLRDELESELHRAQLREGAVPVPPLSDLESERLGCLFSLSGSE